MTWQELLSWALRELEGGSAEQDHVQDARRMVAECAGVEMAVLSTVLSEVADPRAAARLRTLVGRRREGEPLQYVVGSWGFRTLDLMVDRRVLIPRPETEAVVQAALDELDRMGGATRRTLLADLGTGSGAIALSIVSERPLVDAWATDVSEAALAVARANTAGAGRSGARVRTAAGSWFEALPQELRGRFELIVSNPPYIPDTAELPSDVADWEPAGALRSGPGGTDALVQIISGASPWLTEVGVLVCELSGEQAADMERLAARYFDEVRIGQDLAGRDRVLVARLPRPHTS